MANFRCEICDGLEFDEVLTLHENETGTDFSYLQCRKCLLIRVRPEIPADYKREGYVARLAKQALSADKLWNWTFDRIESHSGIGSVIEVGCGIGTCLARAQDRGWSVKGFEINPDCPEIARRLYGIDVSLQSFLEHTESGTADVVLMNQLIEHVPSPMSFVEAAQRALKPGGLLVMSTPNWNAAVPIAWLHEKMGLPLPKKLDHFEPHQHIRLYSPRTLMALAHRAGGEFKAVYENRTDMLGQRPIWSPRRVTAGVTRSIAKLTGDRLQFGINMMGVIAF